MAIMVTEGTTPEKVKEKSFPKLMKRINPDDLIVLFTSLRVGVVIREGAGFNVGKYRDDWLMGNFEEYNDPLILQNK